MSLRTYASVIRLARHRIRAVPPDSLPYRDFYYPLNVFMHILTHEEGSVRYLHYALFDREGESISEAQERSTRILLERLPPPPARILEVGIGLGTTLRRLGELGYDAEGITPDEQQIAHVRAQNVDARVHCVRFETFDPGTTYHAIAFQESSQYIEPGALFARAAKLAAAVIVLDEFALRPVDGPGALHSFSSFIAAAAAHGFSVAEELDVSAQAAPTIDYFLDRLPRYRDRLISDLGLTDQQVDDLITSGEVYARRYAEGVYGYRLLALRRD